MHRKLLLSATRQQTGSAAFSRWRMSHYTSRRSKSSVSIYNPYDGAQLSELEYKSPSQAVQVVKKASQAQREWKLQPLEERKRICEAFVKELSIHSDEIAKDISLQMGKPLEQAKGEVSTTADRARTMIELAEESLAPYQPPPKEGFFRQIVKEPVGVVLVVAPWNYPMLTAVNAIVPAILAGNSVVIKHSRLTPLCADHYERLFHKAGAPPGLVTALHADHRAITKVIKQEEVGFVAFTGSVRGSVTYKVQRLHFPIDGENSYMSHYYSEQICGREIYETIGKSRFIDCTLELGGKDPAYVAPDADVASAAAGLVDGAMYNAGQSCCGIERAYVHKSIYEEFLDECASALQDYKLHDHGPIGATGNVEVFEEAGKGDAIRTYIQDFGQPQCLLKVEDAQKRGAKLVVGGSPTSDSDGKEGFFQPTLVRDCKNDMDIMAEESFGPLLPVAAVSSDEEAVRLMNDSKYGLTAAIFTSDQERAHRLAPQLECGTVFMNRCDFLDPLLAWTGVKDTGKGQSLSKFGFDGFTRLKSYHFRLDMP